jgi:hypothetical protein
MKRIYGVSIELASTCYGIRVLEVRLHTGDRIRWSCTVYDIGRGFGGPGKGKSVRFESILSHLYTVSSV